MISLKLSIKNATILLNLLFYFFFQKLNSPKQKKKNKIKKVDINDGQKLISEKIVRKKKQVII